MKMILALIASAAMAGAVSQARGQTVIAWRSVPGATQPAPEDRVRASILARQSIDCISRNDLTGAENHLRDAIELNPNKAIYHFNLACLLTARHDFDRGMDALDRATDLGFTDFSIIETSKSLAPLHDLPRFKSLVAHKEEVCREAAERALEDLKQQFGKDYLYEVDEEHKLIFAASTDRATLDALKAWLTTQETSQEAELFAHKPDEFVRVVVPSEADFHKLMRVRGVMGIYEDESRTLMAQRLGQVMTHEFTHALHAADQRAAGQEHPVWLREGLASMYEAGEFVDAKLIPRDNHRLAYVQSAARRGALIPLDKVLTLSMQDFIRSPNLAYGESSSLLLFLHEQGQLRKFYDTYKATYADDATGQLALEQTTGMKLPELQSAWQTWMLARQAPLLTAGPRSPYLGVHFGEGSDGLRVTMLLPGGAAAAAGLKVNDVIVGFDGREIRDYASFAPLLASHKVGDAVVVKYRRGGDYLEQTVTLMQR